MDYGSEVGVFSQVAMALPSLELDVTRPSNGWVRIVTEPRCRGAGGGTKPGDPSSKPRAGNQGARKRSSRLSAGTERSWRPACFDVGGKLVRQLCGADCRRRFRHVVGHAVERWASASSITQHARQSRSLGLPTAARIHEPHAVNVLLIRLVGVAEGDDVRVRGRRDPLETRARRSSKRYSFIFRGLPCTSSTRLPSASNRSSLQQRSEKRFVLSCGVRSRPRERPIA